MTTVLIVIHLMVVLAMIGLVLLQRSEGGALGIGGGSGAFLSGRGAGNVLTRSTGILAAIFFATSIGLAILARIESGPRDIFDTLPGQSAPAADVPAAPAPPIGTPTSAEDVLRGLGGSSSAPGPQTPPAGDGGSAVPAEPAAEAPAANGNSPAAQTTAPAPAPAADAAAPAPAAPAPAETPAAGTAPGPQVPPPASGGTQ